jgi:hypothetical protein
LRLSPPRYGHPLAIGKHQFAAACAVIADELFVDQMGAMDAQKGTGGQMLLKPLEHFGHHQRFTIYQKQFTVTAAGGYTHNMVYVDGNRTLFSIE